jgi:hypothetical protein
MDFAAELDALMGKNRNSAIGTKTVVEHFTDSNVCKHFLISEKCPHSLFPNSKYDLGLCKKRHEPYFKTQFESTNELDRAYNEKRYITELLSK